MPRNFYKKRRCPRRCWCQCRRSLSCPCLSWIEQATCPGGFHRSDL